MTQRSAILHKKLDELESELSDLYRIPKTTPVDQFYFDDIKHTIEFLKTLYSVEVSSQHPQNNVELHETGERLSALESAFREWNASRWDKTTNLDDALSVCSDCTYQALLQDEARDQSESTLKPTEKNDSLLEKSLEQREDVVEDSTEEMFEKSAERRVEKGGRFWGKVVRYCGVFGGGIVFGAICVGNYVEILSHFFANCEVFVDFPPPT